MKTDKNTFGIRQDIAEHLAVGCKDASDGPWKTICKKFPDDPPQETPCRHCRVAIHMIEAWDKSPEHAAGEDHIAVLKSIIGEDRYAAFMKTYMAAYTRLLHTVIKLADEEPAKKTPKKTVEKPPKKTAKPRPKRDPDVAIELPPRIRKTKDPEMVKVPLIDEPIPIEDVVLSSFEEEIITRTKTPLAIGTPVERVFNAIAGIIEGMDRTRQMITFAYLPEPDAKKLLDYITAAREKVEVKKEHAEGLVEALAGVAKKIPRSLLREKTAGGWDIVVHVFTPIAIGIVLNRQSMIKEALFEEFLWVFDGAAFVELTEIVCRLFVVAHEEKPDRIMQLQTVFLAELVKAQADDVSRSDLYIATKKVVEETLGSIPEVVEISAALERAIVDEDV